MVISEDYTFCVCNTNFWEHDVSTMVVSEDYSVGLSIFVNINFQECDNPTTVTLTTNLCEVCSGSPQSRLLTTLIVGALIIIVT